MMDQLPAAAFSHTRTHTRSFTPSYRPTGQWETKTSLSWDTPRPVVSNLKSTTLLVSPCLFFTPPFPCSLPHSFLSPVHASGIPLDPLNEEHITGLAKRGEWEGRRGLSKVKKKMCKGARIYRSHPMSGLWRKGGDKKQSWSRFVLALLQVLDWTRDCSQSPFFHVWAVRVPGVLICDLW